ncbi:secreted RxLR effector protein 161-like [Apium graveolens]|uniref:secreted RxLR effector protein 161-like n=1 Tax=Apium graveolens TaxID=4045 RepID=UPI003D79FB64
MDQKLQLDKDEGRELVNATEYRCIVGCLRYLTHSLPDITYVVGVVSRFMEQPTVKHKQAVKQILRYIKGTISYGLRYTRNSYRNALSGYTDTDMAGDVVDRRSTGGMCFYLNGNLISWTSQKQRVIALSSCEAEYMAATLAACQSIWLRGLLREVLRQQVGSVIIYIDNKSAIELMKNPILHGRSKHIDVRFHFIWECIEHGELVVRYVGTRKQKADILTKALGRVKFEIMQEQIGVCDIAAEESKVKT